MRQGVPLTVEGNGKCVYFLACGGLIYRTAMPCHTCSTFRKVLWVLPRANPLHRIETISGQNAAVVAVPALTLSSQRFIIPATDAADHGSATLLNLAMKICFDTSALVAALLQEHPLHALSFPHLQGVRAQPDSGLPDHPSPRGTLCRPHGTGSWSSGFIPFRRSAHFKTMMSRYDHFYAVTG